jgi:hypothetical protein
MPDTFHVVASEDDTGITVHEASCPDGPGTSKKAPGQEGVTADALSLIASRHDVTIHDCIQENP